MSPRVMNAPAPRPSTLAFVLLFVAVATLVGKTSAGLLTEWVAKWLLKSYDFAFGCHYRNLSRVFTIEGRTYRVCCGSGINFKYSLENMSMERHARRIRCQR